MRVLTLYSQKGDDMDLSKINYIGIKKITADEKQDLDTLLARLFPKLERKLPAMSDVTIHIKTYQKGGDRKKYSLHLRVCSGKRVFEAHHHDWDLRTATHCIFNEMLSQLDHQLHTSDQRPKDLLRRTLKAITPEFAEDMGVRVKKRFGNLFSRGRK